MHAFVYVYVHTHTHIGLYIYKVIRHVANEYYTFMCMYICVCASIMQ